MDHEWRITENGYRVKTIQIGSATINIFRPILTEEEKALREAEILHILQQFGRIATDRENKRQ